VAAGATAVIQPGGSVRDAEVIAAADAAGVAMVFTGHAPLPPLTAEENPSPALRERSGEGDTCGTMRRQPRPRPQRRQ